MWHDWHSTGLITIRYQLQLHFIRQSLLTLLALAMKQTKSTELLSADCYADLCRKTAHHPKIIHYYLNVTSTYSFCK